MAPLADLEQALRNVSPELRESIKKPLALFMRGLSPNETVREVGSSGDNFVLLTNKTRYVFNGRGNSVSKRDATASDAFSVRADGGRLDCPIDLTVTGCQVLGGSGFPACVGDVLKFAFDEQGLLLTLPVSGKRLMPKLSYLEIVSLTIAGPGSVTSGGGFLGGGFGLEGAAIGIGLSALLNAATTKTEITTILELTTQSGELFVTNRHEEPGPLRVRLSAVFTRLRQTRPGTAG